jgi:ribosomal subunit interface protein
MHIAMHIGDAALGKAFKSYVDRRLRFALGRFGSHVGPTTVNIGGNGRSESRCQISIEVLPFGRVAAEESGPDLFAAIDGATGKIRRLFGRELERARDAKLGRESVRLAA